MQLHNKLKSLMMFFLLFMLTTFIISCRSSYDNTNGSDDSNMNADTSMNNNQNNQDNQINQQNQNNQFDSTNQNQSDSTMMQIDSI